MTDFLDSSGDLFPVSERTSLGLMGSIATCKLVGCSGRRGSAAADFRGEGGSSLGVEMGLGIVACSVAGMDKGVRDGRGLAGGRVQRLWTKVYFNLVS